MKRFFEIIFYPFVAVCQMTLNVIQQKKDMAKLDEMRKMRPGLNVYLVADYDEWKRAS